MIEPDCPMCGAPLVAITINVGAGERTMCSCARCDRCWWNADGRLTGLDGVLSDLGEPQPSRVRFRR
jgi:hypothetical protein